MSPSILATKLFIPTNRPGMVTRPQLIQRLEDGRERKLTLVCAPAGYGKSTLLAEWINQLASPVGWVSLDAQDNDLGQFFLYFIAGLRTIDHSIDESVSVILKDQNPDSIPGFLSELLNQMSSSSEDMCLILDDYHRIENQEIHDALTFLLGNLPPNMHLVIASRSDPPLRLAKLRAQGDLCEIRVNDLRFSYEEAITFLNHSMNLKLSSRDIVTLTNKTEGWIVGLQLAGITLLNQPDKHQFVITFAGDDRYIADYLLDEVLNRQPKHIHDFLLRTSILERFCASLCNTITACKDSQSILNDLEQENLFLVPLDHQRNWYRYHHLFADLLKQRMAMTLSNAERKALHQDASAWFSSSNLFFEALSHAIEADDMVQVVRLIEGNLFSLLDRGEIRSLVRWLEQIPCGVREKRPWLCIAQAWVYVYAGKLNASEESLSAAEESFSFLNEEDKALAKGHIHIIRAYRYWLQGEGKIAVVDAQKALEILPEVELSIRAFASKTLGAALIQYCDLKDALEPLQNARAWALEAGNDQVYILASGSLAYLLILQGKMDEAERVCLNGLELIAEGKIGKSPAMSQFYEMLSEIAISRNNMDQAFHYAQEGLRISKNWGQFDSLTVGCVYMVTPLLGQRKFDEAREVLSLVKKPYLLESAWFMNIVGKAEAEINLAAGELEAASLWAREAGLDYRDKVLQTNRTAYRVYARILMAEERYSEADHLLEQMILDSENTGAYAYLNSLLPMRSVVQLHLGNQERAINLLQRALNMAAEGGYVREYIRQDKPMAELLRMAIRRNIQPEYAARLLDEIGKTQILREDYVKSEWGNTIAEGGLIETLSNRELEVLHLIAEGCSNKEIAQQLILSLYTIKSHARNIFGKLGVKNRTEAVAKARLYGLLPDK